MYWWNVDSLADELKKGTLSEKEKMKYLLADSIATTAAIFLVSSVSRAASLMAILSAMAGVAIAVVSILLCFTANGGSNGRHFIERFVCLSWPVGIRVVVYMLLPLIVLVMLAVIAKGEGGRFQEILTFAWGVVVGLWVFLWIRRKLTVISTPVTE